MNREYHRWHSPALNRDMELLMFGHAGARVLVFPTSQGRFYEWEDKGMMAALGDLIGSGSIQVTCVDSVDAESWYNWGAHPGARAYRHSQYDGYLYNEVLPLMEGHSRTPFTIVIGASFGAFHAMSFGLKHPERVNRIIGMSGLYNILRFTGGYSDENVYLNNPAQFIAGEHDEGRLRLLRQQDVVMASGESDRLTPSSREMSGILWGKGIGNALRIWDGWAHDWQYWAQMLRLYLGGHD